MWSILTDWGGGQATISGSHKTAPPPPPPQTLKGISCLQISIIIYQPKVPRNSSDGPGPCYAGHCTNAE